VTPLYSPRPWPTLYELYRSNPQPTGGNVWGVEYANCSSAKLADVDDSYYYGVNCRSCLRGARLSLTRLRDLLGDDFLVVRVKTRLKCSICGSKRFSVAAPGGGKPRQPVQRAGTVREWDADSFLTHRMCPYIDKSFY
jgi:hypothetical protein